MNLEFEWDDEEARLNVKKHRVSFEEAMSVFSDHLALTMHDKEHSIDEERFVLMGESERNRILVISFTDRGDRIRIISARVADRRERKMYEEGS